MFHGLFGLDFLHLSFLLQEVSLLVKSAANSELLFLILGYDLFEVFFGLLQELLVHIVLEFAYQNGLTLPTTCIWSVDELGLGNRVVCHCVVVFVPRVGRVHTEVSRLHIDFVLLLIVKLSECLPLSDVFLIELLLQNTIFGFYLGVFLLLLSYLLELPLFLGLKFQVPVV